MLKYLFATSSIIYGLYLISAIKSVPNVCKTLKDYKTIRHNPNCWYNPDVGATPRQIATRYGFPFESHEITTEDGYIISLFRIPHNGTDINRKRPPILLQHGFGADAANWMVSGLQSIVFVFSNYGYDIWMSNSRGSKYSVKHMRYTIYDLQFWDFSFHEIAIYDIPAIIDFIKTETGKKNKIIYIGHSMGTSISYVYASLKPEDAVNNLKSIVSLAPIAYMDHIAPFAKVLAPFHNMFWNIFKSVGFYGVGPNIQFVLNLIHSVCSSSNFIQICSDAAGIAMGKNDEELVASALPIEPPEYPLTRIKVPIHLFYGRNDPLSTEKVNEV
ncbi:Abhydro lipase domain containing protein [Asbolus verrucosus]|uniref:Abhydro lipase domain containing protein n=1 Tax=Asbolus verrucosus TaxID=1661398 RepID=A0A482VQN9_ASBVE|nr:Abhydro lipase domain containing protein [Asbolus verrucosus]